MGRPPGAPTKVVSLNLNQATYDQIVDQAKVRGTPPSTLLRQVVENLYPGISPFAMLPVPAKNGRSKRRK